MASSETDDPLSSNISLSEKQRALKNAIPLADYIKRMATNIKKASSSRLTQGYLSARSELLNEYWSKFREADSVIHETISEEEKILLPYFINGEFATVEESYLETSTYIKQKMLELYPPTRTAPLASSSPIRNANETQPPRENTKLLRLPPITIPKFNGDYKLWPSFFDLFKSLVHDNADISPVHKLHYLKTNLTDEPEFMLRNLPITALNYDSAWEQLVHRYDNKRVLVNSQLKVLFDQPKMTTDSAKSIKNMLDVTSECLNSLRNLGVDTKSWDCIIIYLIFQRLTNNTRQLWEQGQGANRDLPTLVEVTEFLESRYRSLEFLTCETKHQVAESSQARYARQLKRQSYHTSTSSASQSCELCHGEHQIRQCDKFKSKTASNRLEIAKQHNLCTNCLGKYHFASQCLSSTRCSHCQKRHHTMLHNMSEAVSSSIPSSSNVSTSPNQSGTKGPIASTSNVNSYHMANTHHNSVLLATALVRITTSTGTQATVRALLDPGSECSFVTESLVRRLQMKIRPASINISGIGSGQTTSSGQTSFKISSHHKTDINLNIHAFILKSLPSNIPSAQLNSTSWDHTRHLTLADPNFHKPGHIDILLGVDVVNHIMLQGLIKGPIGSPMAQSTMLGWVLSGSTKLQKSNQSSVISCVAHVALQDQLKLFWEVEEIPNNTAFTEEEQLCEDIFLETYKRTDEGRFIVKLPFKPTFGGQTTLGQSKKIALSRLHQLENKLAKKPTFGIEYTQVMQEYLDLHHMEIVPSTEDDSSKLNCCYIPHHAVVKESSSTTKTRVVFDASRPTSSGHSLNDCLLNGPILQEDILSITLRWRLHKVAITSDVAKMYRQIRVYDEDADYQRIVWRWKPDDPVQSYRLLTLTFGTKPAAYLAIKCLQTLAELERETYPEAAQIIKQDFYVDDLLSGSDTVSDAIKKRSEISKILRQGGFDLRKWSSNDASFMEGIPEDERETRSILPLTVDNTIKTLGLYWDPSSDTFQFKVTIDPIQPIMTKRSILSDVAKLFDPQGWLAPVIVRAKILLQSLWLLNVQWDEALPEYIMESWSDYRNDLWSIEKIQIPRWLNTTSSSYDIQLHCFTDASIHAYAAALYIRAVDDNGNVHTHLLTAKTKVSPVKQITLPRLELCGVVLGAKLTNIAVKAIKRSSVKIFGWTDSTIALSWLKGHPNRWTTFVGNRVGEIHRISNTTWWRHVPTKDNPADCASRGLRPRELQSHPLWWQGPPWLCKPEIHWPLLKTEITTNLEEKKTQTFAFIASTTSNAVLERFSTYTRLIRVTAYLRRFINRTRKIATSTDKLSLTEMNESLSYWLKHTQATEFSSSICKLSSKQPLDNSDKMLSLNPILDQHGLLRVGGRLEHTHLCYDAKHPIIVPRASHLTLLIIDHYHTLTLHGGPQVMLGLIRKKFWIIDARNSVRNRISKCVICRRHQAKIRTQLMGQLPASRTTISRPFENSGVDYAGPFEIKQIKGRGSKFIKGYICLFICMATKAVHLELVSDLSSHGFLAAFRRFVSRRGLCSTIFSDNGTNFVGAHHILKYDFNKVKMEDDLSKVLINDGIDWKFIPPSAPNFGGLWEAGIKSTKFHLKRTLGSSHLTYEEFATVLTQIEGILNSRPICPISNDPSDLEALTPGHFLIGDAIMNPPEPKLLNMNINKLDRWQRVQQLKQSFWKRWSIEYVSRLQQRPKWMKLQPNLEINNMVLIKNDNLPPLKWLLGRVVETHPGEDGVVRVVTVKTVNGQTKKSVSKLCLLPIN